MSEKMQTETVTWWRTDGLGIPRGDPGLRTRGDELGSNEMQVFAILDDGALWNRYWDGRRWHDWESLGGELSGNPAATSWGADRIDLFARGRDGTLQHCWYEPGGWSAWESLGGEFTSDPSACSWGPGRIDVFARGTDGDLRHAWWNGGRWSWE